jgi:integrase/recombinase XerC/integrase/recombinase XerD
MFKEYVDEIDIERLTIKTVNMYYIRLSERNLSSVSRQTYIRALRAFLNWCYREEYIPVCLPDKFRLPKAKRNVIDILTGTEVEKLLKTFDLSSMVGLRNYCICILMLDCGLRLNEAVTLQFENVRIAENYMIIDGKGNKQRFVPLGVKSREAVAKYMSARASESGSLFLMSGGGAVSRNAVRQMFRKLKKKTGIPRLKAHLLRHTFATLYLENGGDIYSLQAILGHTSLEMVKRYLHLSKDKLIRSFGKYSPMDNLGINI